MYTFLAISFSIKKHSFADIKSVIEDIYAEITRVHPEDKIILVHGNMPRHEVLQRGWDTEIVDTLDDIFPMQLNCNRFGVVLRQEMAEIIHEFGGEVHVIGDVVDGVAEEVKLYEAVDAKIIYHKLA